MTVQSGFDALLQLTDQALHPPSRRFALEPLHQGGAVHFGLAHQRSSGEERRKAHHVALLCRQIAQGCPGVHHYNAKAVSSNTNLSVHSSKPSLKDATQAARDQSEGTHYHGLNSCEFNKAQSINNQLYRRMKESCGEVQINHIFPRGLKEESPEGIKNLNNGSEATMKIT